VQLADDLLWDFTPEFAEDVAVHAEQVERHRFAAALQGCSETIAEPRQRLIHTTERDEVMSSARSTSITRSC